MSNYYQKKFTIWHNNLAGKNILHCSGATFALLNINIFMPNVVKTNIHLKEESKENIHPEIPVKNKQNDAVKNTAEEPGLNQAATTHNELEPGTDNADDE